MKSSNDEERGYLDPFDYTSPCLIGNVLQWTINIYGVIFMGFLIWLLVF